MSDIPQRTPVKTPPAHQRIRLPFEKRKMDFATWIYYHRAGFLASVIAVLLFCIILVSCKLTMGGTAGQGVLLVDFDKEEQIEQERLERLEQLQKMEAYDYSAALNRISNENSQLNATLRDAQGTDASEIYNDAEGLSDRMQANRDAYEAGLRHVEDMRNRSGDDAEADSEGRQDANVKGKVTVSYSFLNPVRNRVNLPVPAYQCEGGGEVVLNVTLDNNGRITSATVDRNRSTGDDCMRNTAVRAAHASRFNVDSSAPSKHTGTITYIFVPQ